MIGQLSDSRIKLRSIFIDNKMPAELAPLEFLANNIWWSWSKNAIELFNYIDKERLIALNYNPVALLKTLSPDRVEELREDQSFLKLLKTVEQEFADYLGEERKKDQPRIAYFSMEYGLHISLKLYSGGLGVLAGDYLKEASDSNVDLFGIGLLYRYGYFNQGLSMNGDQIHHYPAQKFTQLPVQPVRNTDGSPLKVAITLQGRVVQVKVWSLAIGRITLYLLDTDFEENEAIDRGLTHQLYGGDNEHRLKQEILLGIGGVRAIKALGLQPDIFHLNEGHAGFLSLERLKNFTGAGFRFNEAVEAVRSSSLYTTHTPVPAGHDHFSEHLMRNYLFDYATELGISWNELMGIGRVNPENPGEDFNMSIMSIRLSQQVNGVSELHGRVSQEMFTKLYPGYSASEVHIGYVTNSVHYPTWVANSLHKLFSKHFGKNWVRDQSNPDRWRKIHKVSDEDLWAVRKEMKANLLAYVREKLEKDMQKRGESPRTMFSVLNNIHDNALVLGFARRFATYKRATLLFTNENRLREIVNDPERPVIFLFAGKAHPADQGGQDLIRHITYLSKQPDFAGKIIFLEDYNMEMAKLLTQGVDIWLNTPTRPKEASGTSGMKAALNGSVNFSVLDGWWAEGYRPDAGWALPLERTYQDQALQNELDAERIYSILESEILPIYFERDEHGLSKRWMGYVKQIIAEVAPHFTMKRMLDDYYDRFYNPLFISAKAARQDDYAPAKDFAEWKVDLQQRWSGLQTLNIELPQKEFDTLPVGEPFSVSVALSLNGIPPEHLRVEVLFFEREGSDQLILQSSAEFQLAIDHGAAATYSVTFDPQLAGDYEYGFRVSPKHPMMPHQQDLSLVYWA